MLMANWSQVPRIQRHVAHLLAALDRRNMPAPSSLTASSRLRRFTDYVILRAPPQAISVAMYTTVS